MKKKLNTILLIDDNPADNLYHRIIIESENVTEHVQVVEDGIEAMAYLMANINENHAQPDLIFLDINMPKMNGWEFLAEYNKLELNERGRSVIVMLSTSDAIEDKLKAKQYKFIQDYSSKPLSSKMLHEVIQVGFPDYI
ncbi:response regulator [Roseivirga echinicomitans]